MVTTTRQRMTATQATQFDRYSVGNAAIITKALRCECKPYVDVLTLKRWNALGMRVKAGEKSTVKIGVLYNNEETDEDGNVTVSRRRSTSAVFCRHQVAPSGKAQAPAPHATTPRPKPTITPAPTITSTHTSNTQVDQIMADWKVV